MKHFFVATIIIFLSVFSSSETSVCMAQEGAPITLEQIWQDYEFIPKSLPGLRFQEDGKHFTRLEGGKVIQYDITSGDQTRILFDTAFLTDYSDLVTGYTFSSDEKKLLLESQPRSIYRRSREARYVVYELGSMTVTPVFDEGKIRNAQFDPTGTKVAFVFENDLYVRDLKTGDLMRITDDGETNAIINGSSDWVYEEEFSIVRTFEWAPDGKHIAFLRFDEREVPEFTMMEYRNDIYPDKYTFKYPKVGEKNSVVSVHFFNLEKAERKDVVVNGPEIEYFPRIQWTQDPRFFSFQVMNRWQNRLDLYLVDVRTGKAGAIMTERNPYYIDVHDNLYFLEDGERFIWSSEESGYNHLYLYNLKGEKLGAVTKGEWEVTEFYGVDEKRGRVFFQAAMVSPMQREVYSIGLDGNNLRAHASIPGTNNAQFSKTFDYFVHSHSTINTPPNYMVRSFDGDTLRIEEANVNLRRKQVEHSVRSLTFFDFKGPDRQRLNGWMLKPHNMEEGKKYPVLMFVYGGPGSQQVLDSWRGQNYWWFQMLAQQGYVVACVDNRGTGGRGQEFKKMTYLQLGNYETEDQIATAQHLANMPFVDGSRIGIFGWSYGGYMSSLCILKGNDTFKAAIAVAPVTNWKWYDSIYTERYMRTLRENNSGYTLNSPINYTNQLKGNYLLIHGMSDDNVHFQNTAEMAKYLIAANKQFDTYFYPNKNHGIGGGNTRLHLYAKMTDFILNKI